MPEVAGYDPSVTRERLEARREMAAGNLDGYRKQAERMGRPPTQLLLDAIKAEQRWLDQINRELARLARVGA